MVLETKYQDLEGPSLKPQWTNRRGVSEICLGPLSRANPSLLCLKWLPAVHVLLLILHFIFFPQLFCADYYTRRFQVILHVYRIPSLRTTTREGRLYSESLSWTRRKRHWERARAKSFWLLITNNTSAIICFPTHCFWRIVLQFCYSFLYVSVALRELRKTRLQRAIGRRQHCNTRECLLVSQRLLWMIIRGNV